MQESVEINVIKKQSKTKLVNFCLVFFYKQLVALMHCRSPPSFNSKKIEWR